MKILIVAVNYNSYKQLGDFLESVRKSINVCTRIVNVDVVVADNSTQKEQVQFLKGDKFSLQVFPLDNLGYFGGAQYIINKIEDKSKYDYIAISNVDLILQEDFFEVLSQYKCPIDVGWIAPSVFSLQEKRDKKSLYRPSKQKFWLLCLLFKYPLLFKIYRKSVYIRKRESSDLTESSVVYSGHGAFILLTKRFFIKNPQLDFKPFLFCEENYIAELLRESALKCIYEPSLKILDEEHVSTGKMNYRKMCKYNYEAHKFIYETFYRKSRK